MVGVLGSFVAAVAYDMCLIEDGVVEVLMIVALAQPTFSGYHLHI